LDTKHRGLCIATRCATVEEFVARFHPFCDERSIFVTTNTVRAVGTEFAFAIVLADMTPVLRGRCAALEAWTGASNRYGRPGMRLGIRALTAPSTRVFETLLAARRAATAIVRPGTPMSRSGRIAVPVPRMPVAVAASAGADPGLLGAALEPAVYPLFDGEVGDRVETVALDAVPKLAEGTLPIAKAMLEAEPWCAPTREVDGARLRELVRQTIPPVTVTAEPAPALATSSRRAVVVIGALVLGLASAIALGIACV
jgi:hypothetical protein